MEHCVLALAWRLARVKLSARDILHRHAQSEECRSQMFRRVNGPIDAQYALGAGNSEIVGERGAVMREAGAPFGSGESGDPQTARAAMQVNAQSRG